MEWPYTTNCEVSAQLKELIIRQHVVIFHNAIKLTEIKTLAYGCLSLRKPAKKVYT